MRKIFMLERVTGVVALSYLLLIPAAGYVAFRKIQDLDKDITTMWADEEHLNPRTPIFNLRDRFSRRV